MRRSWRRKRCPTGREYGHLIGDVPALLLVAGVLWFLSPKGERFVGAAG